MVNMSAKQVGCELVRQYYTMLNMCPQTAHRFYTSQSCMVHDDPLSNSSSLEVVGQEAIHKKILELGYKDCTTKILYVECCYTVDRGVVVQVLGYLTRLGESPRMFSQTFFLAYQNVNHYFINVNIFKYLDNYTPITDLGNTDSLSFKSEALNTNPVGPYNNCTPVFNAPNQSLKPSTTLLQPSITLPHTFLIHYEPPSTNEILNGTAFNCMSFANIITEEAPNTGYLNGENSGHSDEIVKTFANLFKNPSVVANSSSKQDILLGCMKPISENAVSDPEEPPRMHSSPKAPKNPLPTISYQETVYQPTTLPENLTENTGTLPEKHLENKGTSDWEFFNSYPQQNQLFIGNIPFGVTEEELKEVFSKFGNLVNLRLNSQNRNELRNGHLPNYGFVAFADPMTVAEVLGKKPVYTKSGHRINVEEKKRRVPDRNLTWSERTGKVWDGLHKPSGYGNTRKVGDNRWNNRKNTLKKGASFRY